MPKDSDTNINSPVADGQAIAIASGQLESPELRRQQAWQRIRNALRPGQQRMADWEGGQLAVSAVPGAGKSTGMAGAAALAIARYQLHHRRQLVVVTFTRSAAANIKTKIRQSLRDLSIPQAGYTVNTLHGLALNIATRHPELSGLNLDNTTLVTLNQSHRLIRACVERWIAANPRRYQVLVEGHQFDGEETERLRRQSVLRTEMLPQLATTAIHEAKSSGLLPKDLWEMTQYVSDDYETLAIAAGLYDHYQSVLRSRDFIDYDDMILAALRVLDNPATRQLWQNQVFAVFEDEAQDSTPLQTQLLEILATHPADPNLPPNLIRVGDPNQAINSTFTPADPIYFRRFCEECKTQERLATMDEAGRSSEVIIRAANFVLEWVNKNWERGTADSGLKTKQSRATIPPSQFPIEPPFRVQPIRPVDPGDPQPDANPKPEGRGLEIYTPRDIYHTVELIGQRAIALFGEETEKRSAAILVRENRQGKFLEDVLRNPRRYGINCDLSAHGIEVYEVAARDRRSHIPAEVLALLHFCDRPHSPDNLKGALTVLVDRQLIPTQDLNALTSLPEQFLYPGPLEPPQPEPVLRARRLCCSLLRARMELPLYQLISFFALALKYNQAELATADKLGDRVAQQTAGNSSMEAILDVLNEIVTSERFEPVETEENESLYTRAGQLTIITMHKAKGLDWDYVFIPFLHENMIPGHLWIPPKEQFLGDFTLAEVARAQIRASLHGQYPLPEVTDAWEQAGQLKSAEEYRLLYVAMTRAKRLLWMSAAHKAPFTWSKPENMDDRKPCPVIPALKSEFPQSIIPICI